MTVEERIAWQAARVKELAEKAARGKRPPEPPAPPIEHRRFTEEERVRAFAEDRVYDDVPTGKKPFDAGGVDGMSGVRSVLVAENPREFVAGPREQAAGGMDFRNIGMEDIEGPGYSAIVKREAEEERVAPAPESSSVRKVRGIQIDLGGPMSNQLDAINRERQAARQEPRQEPPAEDAMGMTGVQRQMLAAMRAQRDKMKF